MGFTDWLFGADPDNTSWQNIQGPQHFNAATNQLGQMANQTAPMVGAAQLANGNINQSRAGLMGTANNLSAIASGQQQGAGQIAVNRQVGQAQAQQAAMAQAARGGNAALAMRNAARNTADIGLQGAGQAAQAQQSDQLAANQQLGSIYGNMYGQDASVAAQNAQLAQQAALANQSAGLQQQGLNQNALGQQLQWDQALTQEQIAKQQAQVGNGGAFGSVLNAVGSVVGHFSDARLKNNIADGQHAAMNAVTALAPVTYAYNDPRMGAGPQLGTTAQDLERAGLGSVVVDTPQGKLVDGSKLAGANTAMIAALGNRLAQLEGNRTAGTGSGYELTVGKPVAAGNAYDLTVGTPVATAPMSAGYALQVGAPVVMNPDKRRDSRSGTSTGARR